MGSFGHNIMDSDSSLDSANKVISMYEKSTGKEVVFWEEIPVDWLRDNWKEIELEYLRTNWKRDHLILAYMGVMTGMVMSGEAVGYGIMAIRHEIGKLEQWRRPKERQYYLEMLQKALTNYDYSNVEVVDVNVEYVEERKYKLELTREELGDIVHCLHQWRESRHHNVYVKLKGILDSG